MKCTGYIDDVFQNDAKKKLLSPQNVIERLPIDKLPWVPETFMRSFRSRSSRAVAFGQRRVGMRPYPKHLRRTHSSHGRKEKNTGNHGIDMSELTKMKWLHTLKVARSRKCSHDLKLAADIRELKERRFWPEVSLFHFKAPWRTQTCISKCLYYYRDDLSKILAKPPSKNGKYLKNFLAKAHYYVTRLHN